MHNPTVTIRAVEVFPVGIPVKRTFTFASGSAGRAGESAAVAFVKMTDSTGRVGWGEARPSHQWSYETIESVVTTLRKYLIPAIIGRPLHDRHGIRRKMDSVIGRGPSTGQPIAKAALDLAIHDLCARRADLPLRAFLGGSPENAHIDLSWTVTAHDVDSVAADVAEGRAAGMKHFNFKPGVKPETDLEVARAISSNAPDGAFIWADANQGLNLAEAVGLANSLNDAGVRLLEQPLPADQMHLMQQLRQRSRMALAVDESSVSPGDFFRYASAGLVDYYILKLTRSGGILPVLDQLAVAASAGLPFLVSGLTDCMLGKMAACQVAAAYGFQGPAALNGSQFLDESAIFPDKQRFEFDGSVHLDETPGIGIEPCEEVLHKSKLEWT